MEGTTIGPYRLVRKIGEGGMSAVYGYVVAYGVAA
jgi:hypothetical protein